MNVERTGGPFPAARFWHWALVVSHVVVAAFIVFMATFGLGAAQAAPDEFTYRTCAESYLRGGFRCNLEHPPLAKELLALFFVAGGHSITTARLAAALAAIATATCCYLFVTAVAGRGAGLVAAFAFGALPQQGVEGSITLEAVRIDRYGLLDPFVACFFALSLVLGLLWWERGGWRLAAGTGAACAAAACAKVTGALIAPVILIVPLVAALRRRNLLKEAGAALAGVAAVLVAVYAPLGPVGAIQAIRYMFNYQGSRPDRSVLLGHHLYFVAPWWSDLYFAITGMTALIAITLVAAAAVGAIGRPGPALYALGASASILIVTGFGLHLSAPHYYLDWLPGVVIAAAIGLSVLWRRWITRPLVFAVLVIFVLGAVWATRDAVELSPGPYQLAAPAAGCHKCVTDYIGYANILVNYVPSSDKLYLGAPVIFHAKVAVETLQDNKSRYLFPSVVIVDPAVLSLHPEWRYDVRTFESDARRFGFIHEPSPGRIKVYRHAQ